MRAIGRYLVIKEIKESGVDKVASSGLLITQKQKSDVRYLKGEVFSVGHLVEGVKDGDKIYYDKAAGFGVEINEDLFLVIKEGDVVIVI